MQAAQAGLRQRIVEQDPVDEIAGRDRPDGPDVRNEQEDARPAPVRMMIGMSAVSDDAGPKPRTPQAAWATAALISLVACSAVIGSPKAKPCAKSAPIW